MSSVGLRDPFPSSPAPGNFRTSKKFQALDACLAHALSFLYASREAGSLAVRHRDIYFDVNEVEPSKWRWVIYQRIASDPAIRDKTSYNTRDEAIIACQRVIDDKFPQKKRR
jgi:hypothetical protein